MIIMLRNSEFYSKYFICLIYGEKEEEILFKVSWGEFLEMLRTNFFYTYFESNLYLLWKRF